MLKVVLPFIAQPHQTLHSLPIGMEIAARSPDVEVQLACMTESHLEYARELAAFYPESRVSYELLRMPQRLRRRIEEKGPGPLEKISVLAMNRSYFSQFSGIVVPERTSLYLKRMGVRKPRLAWTRHGAGDRAVGFAKDTRLFDFIVLSGKKIEKRLLQQGAITPGRYHRGTYAKFDIVQRMNRAARPLFNNARPVVLYNPHFSSRLSSWEKFGDRILAFFAQQDRYNLVFAPHVRLFDRNREAGEMLRQRFSGCENLLIDPGSTRSVDMTYTMAADLYLGDVSSQVAEFMIRPRPCIFLNAHNARWENDSNYSFWQLGDVLDGLDGLADTLESAFLVHPQFRERQVAYFSETFELPDNQPTAPAAADAMVDYLRRCA